MAPRSFLPPPPTSSFGKWRVQNLRETHADRMGVQLAQTLLRVSNEELLTLPRRSDGSWVIPHPSQRFFLERLLSNGIVLKEADKVEVINAQIDLRVLTCPQLLAIRIANLDFATQSSSHSAHTNFLDSVKSLLCEKLAKALLGRGASNAQREETVIASFTKPQLIQLGRRCLFAFGAYDHLEQQEHGKAKELDENSEGRALSASSSSFSTTTSSFASSAAPSLTSNLPSLWALVPDGSDADGRAVLLDMQNARLEVFTLEPPSMPDTHGELVGLVIEKADGVGAGRCLHWEILSVESHEVVAELNRLSEAAEKSKAFGSELSDSVKRRAAGRSSELGLDHLEEARENHDAAILGSEVEREPPQWRRQLRQVVPQQQQRQQQQQQQQQHQQASGPAAAAAAPFWQVKLRPVRRPEQDGLARCLFPAEEHSVPVA
mmetsp:Transcript_21700/g.46427  ORF Transcript_21700/g.46427 Transcript_21700/m.46427 type:complete len:434 (-) Transcript_21700:621-1922(-)|eukprot:CAMPEP_0206448654 /NCGR_PEP_ID=MMETSP0324_2-20121206/17602_1 /ASSEMBLY_ACC=CAM_ASM_000836 /TAXON_ID=2866 /ORGANISM="Crypthecodinium cohnii, Strain Seligo" /LENGTH=433 /DNA_ID=CAMNT_0053917841 /DNA_START=79 /DNA_END=1380 /DNA_ORIENTATION=+